MYQSCYKALHGLAPSYLVEVFIRNISYQGSEVFLPAPSGSSTLLNQVRGWQSFFSVHPLTKEWSPVAD